MAAIGSTGTTMPSGIGPEPANPRSESLVSSVVKRAAGLFERKARCFGEAQYAAVQERWEDTAGLLEFTRKTGELVKSMRACPQPIVAAIDGICVGAGAILAMASDLRLGTARAKVAFLFNKVGLGGCDMGACAILPRLVGQGRASELLYTGRSMGGEEAERWGFFNRLAEPDAVLMEARALAAEIAAGPTFAHAMTKRMLHMEWAMSVDDAIEAEAVAQALCMTTEDFARAFRAFSNKERPVFEGN